MNVKQLKEVLANVSDDYEVRYENESFLSDLTAIKIQSNGTVHLGETVEELDCPCPYCDTLDKEVHSFE